MAPSMLQLKVLKLEQRGKYDSEIGQGEGSSKQNILLKGKVLILIWLEVTPILHHP